MDFDFEFLHGQSYDEYSFCVEKRYEQYYTLQFMAKGTVKLSYDGQETALSGSWLWPCFPGPLIRFEPGISDSWEHRYVALKGSQILEWWVNGLWPREPQRVHSSDMAERFDKMLDLFQAQTTFARQRANNLLEGILLELADERTVRPQRRQAWLDDCIRKMAVSNFQNNNYEEIAASWGMSLSTMRRRFKQLMGQSIHNYALSQRMLRAQALLRDSEQPIKSIADQLGYKDVFFFTRQFKQWTGTTPGLYRRSRQGI